MSASCNAVSEATVIKASRAAVDIDMLGKDQGAVLSSEAQVGAHACAQLQTDAG